MGTREVELVMYVDDESLLCRVMSRRIKAWFPKARVHSFVCAKDAEDFVELIDELFVLITDGNLGGAPGVQETGVMVIEAVRAVLDRRGRRDLLVQEVFFSGRMGDFRTDLERLSQTRAVQAVEKPNYEELRPMLARWLSPVRHLIYLEGGGDLWRSCMEELAAGFQVQLHTVRQFAEVLQAFTALPRGERFMFVTSGLIRGSGLRQETGPEVIEKLRRELAQSGEQARLVGAIILSSDDLAVDARRLTLPEQPVELVSRAMAHSALRQHFEHWLRPRR